MRRNSYISSLTADQVLSYILRSLSEGKTKDEIAERFDGDTKSNKKLGRCFEANTFCD